MRGVVPIARQQSHFHSDVDFLRHPDVLGEDYRIVERIRSDFPKGTGISVLRDDSYSIEIWARVTRIWLALLPDYPISSASPLVICPPSTCQLETGDAVLERGERLLLVGRGEG